MLNVDFCLPRSIRVKLNSKCQYKCKFCHQEGNINTPEIDGDELIEVLKFFNKNLGIQRVHFTGGEPTLYEEFAKLLQKLKKLGFINAVTSNGQFKTEALDILKEAGLNSINFSLHAIDTRNFLNIQNISLANISSSSWAKNCIERTKKNIISANNLIDTKVNCVVGEDIISAQKILKFCAQNKIKLRFLNNLNIGEEAVVNIQKILAKNKAELINHEITFLSSSHRLDYRMGNYKFGVKLIRPFFLNSLCNRCKFRNTNKCLESFYGIRLEGKPLKVRLCLNRNEKPFVQDFNAFIKSRQFKEIKNITDSLSFYLKRDSVNI